MRCRRGQYLLGPRLWASAALDAGCAMAALADHRYQTALGRALP